MDERALRLCHCWAAVCHSCHSARPSHTVPFDAPPPLGACPRSQAEWLLAKQRRSTTLPEQAASLGREGAWLAHSARRVAGMWDSSDPTSLSMRLHTAVLASTRAARRPRDVRPARTWLCAPGGSGVAGVGWVGAAHLQLQVVCAPHRVLLRAVLRCAPLLRALPSIRLPTTMLLSSSS
jgi:hypothetical protein